MVFLVVTVNRNNKIFEFNFICCFTDYLLTCFFYKICFSVKWILFLRKNRRMVGGPLEKSAGEVLQDSG